MPWFELNSVENKKEKLENGCCAYGQGIPLTYGSICNF